MLILQAWLAAGRVVITRDDVAAASKQAEPAEEIRTPRVEARAAREDVRIPIKGVRKSTADAMVRSAFTAPHVSVFLDCDVSATMRLVTGSRLGTKFADSSVPAPDRRQGSVPGAGAYART